MTCKQVTAEKMLRISPEFAVWVEWLNKKGYPTGYPFLFKREMGIEFGIAHKSYNNQGGKHSIRELSPEVSPKFNFIFLN